MIVAVILSWHNVDDTIACIDSLRASTRAIDAVLLYDNGSTDGSGAALAAHFAADDLVHVAINTENLGFARGVNAGIRAAMERGATRVLVLNNDTIVDPACVAQLDEALDAHPRAAMAGPTIPYHDRPGIIWQAGGRWSRVRAGLRVPLKNRPIGERPAAVTTCSFLTGCALLVRREAFERAGLFDERYYFYGEDADLCRRMLRAGYDLLHVPDAIVLHKIGDITRSRMSPFVLYHRGRAVALIPRLHDPLWYRPWAIALQLFVATPFRIVQLLRGGWQSGALRAWFAGLADGFRAIDTRRH